MMLEGIKPGAVLVPAQEAVTGTHQEQPRNEAGQPKQEQNL